ncbi:triple tyrosine motif-containing protein [Paraflavitalea speifideaquila]|uniref:triple tyrosine motif-containing protein n=1 Tax=Paraflavitalea speifideaquila TaxID=3076558 RepID=UPI0028ED84A1|nr:triple tyrosine motif-containing protein [Paraflavitalea speifideiaquila]
MDLKTEKEYTNLSYGNYTFAVKARNNLGLESEETRYSFTILPAFYQTNLAKTFYVLLFISLLYLLYRRQKRKFIHQQQKYQQKQEHLISLHQLELERNEKALIKVQNDKLASDVHFKNRELATVTMHLVDRGKVLSNIKEVLHTTIKKLEPTVTQDHFKRVMRLFEDAENNEEDWEHFSRHFDEVHSNFLAKVKKHFPMLTTTDLKLCAYLHIDLTSKEIAQLLGISVRGVETSRYRLRRKLGIPGEVSLNAYLLEAIENR